MPPRLHSVPLTRKKKSVRGRSRRGNRSERESKEERRKAAASYLRELRSIAGITQKELADNLGYRYTTVISQVETGIIRLPPDKLVPWAESLKQSPKEFARKILAFYEPEWYEAIKL